MKQFLRWAGLLAVLLGGASCFAQGAQVIDIATRPGITQRMLVMEPAGRPAAALLLMTGGNGYVGIFDNGSLRNEGNFLVRSRSLFAGHGFAVLVLDPPSDHGRAPFLGGTFRESDEHATDIGAAVAWARQRFAVPVWVVGTSRGTHSAAHAAVVLTGASAPDGIVLTSSILAANRFGSSNARPVQEMALEKVAMPVLVTHHAQDQCEVCSPLLLPALMGKLKPASSRLVTYTGGRSVGNPCEAFAFNGYNGIEEKVVADNAAFVAAPPK
jgi:hypothetical protein